MRPTVRTSVLCLTLVTTAAPAALAQDPPHKTWDVTVSVGIAATKGNSDTSQFNTSYDLTYDPQTKNVVKSDALFLRGTTEGILSAERFLLNARDEYRLGARAFVFGQNLYLRDKFKSISHLDALTGGIGYKLVDTERTKLDADGSLGGVWEKNLALPVRKSGAVTVGEKVEHQLTSSTTLTQSVNALWKTNDAEDALYTFVAGIAVAVSTRVQLKFEVLDVYKNKPAAPGIERNDVATVVAVVFKS